MPTKRHILTTAALTAALLGALPAVAQEPAPQKKKPDNQDQPIEVTFIANEGVLVETGGKKILVDALFREPNPAYAAPPAEVLEKLETAQPPFDDVDLILTTHRHADHFDAHSVARHLRHNPRAVFLSTPEAVDDVRSADERFREIEDRVRTETLKPLTQAEHTIHGIRVRVIATLHSGGRESPQNFMYLLTVGSATIFHEGDSEGEVATFQGLGLEQEEIDAALVHFWFVFVPQGQEILNRYIKPKQILLIHTPIADEARFRGLIEEHRTELGDVTLLTEALEKRVIP